MAYLPSTFLYFIGGCVLVGQAGFGLIFFISCLQEKEYRAVAFSAVLLVITAAASIAYILPYRTGFFHTPSGSWIILVVLCYGIVAGVSLYLPLGRDPLALKGTRGLVAGSPERFDERETVFARDRLQPGTEEYSTFYGAHPGMESRDTKRRSMGGTLGNVGAMDKPWEKPNIAALSAQSLYPYLLSTPDRLSPKGSAFGPDDRPVLGPEEAAERVKGYALSIGADPVGITEIDARWVYSHRGMANRGDGERWGEEIILGHKYAVVMATEMRFEMVRAAPHTPSIVETMRNYAQGAIISSMVAGYIANLGYSATAQHVSHYDALLVPLAIDAGLGQLGRHGYLISKEFGPRLRLAAVTTDIPLIADTPADIGVHGFCRICRKCAVCCPSHSIPMGDPEVHNGILRWKLNAETCHDYWGKSGSDCNICMRVCPWSHPRSLPHRLITASVSRNRLSRRLFSATDDLFYGKNPGPGSPPSWAAFRNSSNRVIP